MYDYKKLEREINEIVELTKTQLPLTAQSEIQEYLEAGEYGLAFDTFTYVVVEEQKSISSAIFEKCEEIAKQMDLPAETCEKMRHLIC